MTTAHAHTIEMLQKNIEFYTAQADRAVTPQIVAQAKRNVAYLEAQAKALRTPKRYARIARRYPNWDLPMGMGE